MTSAGTTFQTVQATVARELLSHRLNRFLFLHVLLMAAIGLLALLAPPEAAATGTSWWVLNGVLYVATLSSLLLGLSSAQAEAEEFPLLFTQPISLVAWVAGKCGGLALMIVPSAVLLVLPTVLASGYAPVLAGAAALAAGLGLLLGFLGFALGMWIQDPVRGLIAALMAWCILLFGIDLLLILVGGSTWVQSNPAFWVAALMLSPLDAYRVTLLFLLERAAFSEADVHPLTSWWIRHPVLWICLCLLGWGAVVATAAVRGTIRRARS